MNWLNETLKDETAYMEYVNKFVLELYGHYQGLLTRGGWFTKAFTKELIKGIIEGFKKEHVYNCLNCESHRWAIVRALRLKYDI